MTQYERPSFSVAQRGRGPAQCDHGWLDPTGRCVFCGFDVERWMRDQEDRAKREATP